MSKNKLVIITGFSRGIGQGVLQNFQEKAPDWLSLGIARSAGQKFQPDYQLFLDLADLQAITKIKAKIQSLLPLNEICFVHNYGETSHHSILDLPDEDYERVLRANLHIPLLCTREISPLMPIGSSHLFIGSTLSTMAVSHSAIYAISKHALLGLMRVAAVDLKPLGLRANLICPGFTETEMAQEVMNQAAIVQKTAPQIYKEQITRLSPLNRLLKPDEIGSLVLYLAQTPAINGELIHINGGFGL